MTLVVVYRTARGNRTASDYYAAGRAFTGAQNGVAIAGDYLSAASFLGIAGAIALNGYDGFLYSIGFLVAWLVALLLVAELLRNTGKFTIGDVLAFRMRQRPVRAAAAVSTLVVSLFYLLAQMAGAGGLVALLLQVPADDKLGQGVVIAVVGALMIVYVLVGGMKGTTYVQIIKAVLLLLAAGVLTTWVLGYVGFDLSGLLGQAAAASAKGEQVLAPGLQYLNPLDFVSLALALVLGTAGLPHILMRFYTVPTATEARRSVVWAIWLIGLFYLFTLVLGYGAGALLPPGTITPANQNNAAPLLAYALGGELMLGLVSAIAFATILAVVAGLTITASASFAHDVYATIIKRGQASPAVGGAGGPAHGAGRRDARGGGRDRGERAERGVPGGAGVRGGGVGEPADDPLLAVLAALQHHGRAVLDLRRPGRVPRADRVLARGVGQADVDDQGRGLPLVPAGQPGDRRHPAVVPARRRGHVDRRPPPGRPARRARPARRDGGPGAHRRRRRVS